MAKAETISSAANPLVKDVRRAIVRGGLTSQGWCVAETFHLLEEALGSDCEVKAVLASESARAAAEARLARRNGIRVAILPDRLFQNLSGTEASQGVMALVQPASWSLDQVLGGCALVVVLDGLRDPGNAGAILRAAEAFGATGALFLKGTVSPYNPKTVRAAAGSLFRLPLVDGVEPAAARAALRQHGVALFAAVPARTGQPAPAPAEVDFTAPCGLIIGNEARGVSGEWRTAAHEVSIPTAGVESLNAAVAAGILLYEARRQRSTHP